MPRSDRAAAISSPTRTTLQASLSVRKLPVGVYSCPAGMVWPRCRGCGR